MAVTLSASGFAGFFVSPPDQSDTYGERGKLAQAWVMVAVISVLSAIVHFFRQERPKDLGQSVDRTEMTATITTPGAVSPVRRKYPIDQRRNEEACKS